MLSEARLERVYSEIDKYIAEKAREEFADIIAGDWDNDIKKLFAILKKKIGSTVDLDMIILCLFHEILNQGKIEIEVNLGKQIGPKNWEFPGGPDHTETVQHAHMEYEEISISTLMALIRLRYKVKK